MIRRAALAALLLLPAPLLAQDTELLPGESITIRAKDSVRVVIDSIPYPVTDTFVVTDTLEVPVPGCPEGWICTPPEEPPPDSTPPQPAVYVLRATLEDGSVHLSPDLPGTLEAGSSVRFDVYRTDSCGWNWTGDPNRTNPQCPWQPFPDSLVFTVGGASTVDVQYRYEIEVQVPSSGRLELGWEAFGAGAASGGASFDVAAGPAPDPPEPTGPSGDFVLLLDDGFDGTELDASTWNPCFRWCPSTINAEEQFYAPDRPRVADGALHLTATREARGGKQFVSAAIDSYQKFDLLYGVVEARIKLPVGKGLWPAFWTMPTDESWPPEIDVMEHIGDFDRVFHSLHISDGQGVRLNVGAPWAVWPAGRGNAMAEWNTYTLDWQPDRLTFYTNGQQTAEVTNPAHVPQKPMYLLLNLAVGGSWPGSPDASTLFPATVEVDYVRAWQRPAAVGLTPRQLELLEKLFGAPWHHGPSGDRYEALWAHWSEKHEAQRAARIARIGSMWEECYYDCGLGWMGQDYAVGDEIALQDGFSYALDYRDNYVRPNNGRVPPRWIFPEGLAVHYVLTGDPLSLHAIRQMADSESTLSWITGRDTTTQYRDGRIQGRTILVQQVMYLLTGEPKYRTRAREGIRQLLKWYDAAGGDGRWDSGALATKSQPPYSGAVSYCDGMATFQVAHALLKVFYAQHEWVEPVPRIREVYTETLDRSWTFWTPGAGFAYIQPPRTHGGGYFGCEGSGSNKPAKDVTLLISTAYAQGYALTGQERFRAQAREIWDYGVSGSVTSPTIFWAGDKQVNQSVMHARSAYWLMQ